MWKKGGGEGLQIDGRVIVNTPFGINVAAHGVSNVSHTEQGISQQHRLTLE